MKPDKAKELILSGKLPPGTTVEGSLCLVCYIYLTTLPEGLKVKGWLYLLGCTSLTTIPEDLIVEGGFDLEKCTSLQLPKGIPEGVQGTIWIDEETLRNNKDHILTMINANFSPVSKERYKKALAEG